LNYMALLTKKQFEELASFHGAHCASIYMPTQRAGEEVIEGQYRIVFEKHLREVRDKLKNYGLSVRETEEFLAPGWELAENSGFWRKQSDGLAVFINKDGLSYYAMPLRFEDYNYVADHYYVKPMIPYFNESGRFFILGLTLHGAQFYEATPHTITEVFVEDLTPARLEEVVGYDYEEKSLQWRSHRGGDPGYGAMFHGQGEQTDKRREEVLQYLRAINQGIMDGILYDLKDPLVVVSQDFLFPMYQKANKYKYLIEDHVEGNPSQMEPALIHEKAWEKVRPVFEEKRQEKLKLYEELAHTARTSDDLDEIVPGAIHGRVDTLFLKNREDVYGTFDQGANKVNIDKEKDISNASLLNMAAAKTFLQNGTVYLLEPEEMPVEVALANAVFRY